MITFTPMIGTSGSRSDIDTGLDRIHLIQTVVENGEPVEKKHYLGYVSRQPDSVPVITAKLTDGEMKDLRLALAERDSAVTGKTKFDHAKREVLNVPLLGEGSDDESEG